MAMEQGIKNLKLEGINKVLIFPADWITGVDYKDNDYDNEKYDEYVDGEQDYEYDNKLEYEQAYNRIYQEEIDELFSEPSNLKNNNNDNPKENDNKLSYDGNSYGDEVPDKSTSARPTKTQTEPERWTYIHKQTTKPKRSNFMTMNGTDWKCVTTW